MRRCCSANGTESSSLVISSAQSYDAGSWYCFSRPPPPADCVSRVEAKITGQSTLGCY